MAGESWLPRTRADRPYLLKLAWASWGGSLYCRWCIHKFWRIEFGRVKERSPSGEGGLAVSVGENDSGGDLGGVSSEGSLSGSVPCITRKGKQRRKKLCVARARMNQCCFDIAWAIAMRCMCSLCMALCQALLFACSPFSARNVLTMIFTSSEVLPDMFVVPVPCGRSSSVFALCLGLTECFENEESFFL